MTPPQHGVELRAWAEEVLADDNPEALFIDGMDAAILGVGRQYTKPTVVIYDEDLIVKTLSDGEMDEEEAREYYDFNIAGAWVGENTPIIVRRPGEEPR